MEKFIANLKRQAEDNPVFALATGAALLQGISKLLQTNTNRVNAKAWSKEVDRRSKMSRK